MDFLKVTSSPHMRHEDSTRIIMLDVLIALCPALIWAVIVFGARALILTLTSAASCVLFEFLYRLIVKKPCSVGDLSAAVTGVLLAFCLPVSVPLWLPVVGAFFAIVIVKQLYGGIGKNVVNPALAARVFLFLAYPDKLGGSAFTIPKASLPLFGNVNLTPDVVASATPLAKLSEGAAPTEDIFTLFLGERAGCIGEVSILMILAGALYLLVRKIITWHIPVAYIVTVAVVSYIFPASSMDAVQCVLCELCSGGVMLAAFFMATDYTTSPVTEKGKVIFGLGCAALTMIIRIFGSYPEGVSYAILLMNIICPLIDRATKSKPFGGVM